MCGANQLPRALQHGSVWDSDGIACGVISDLEAQKVINCRKSFGRFGFYPDTTATGHRFARVPDRRAQTFHRFDSRRICGMNEVRDGKISIGEHCGDVFKVHLNCSNLVGIFGILCRHLNDPASSSQEEMVRRRGLAETHAVVRFAALDDTWILRCCRSERQGEYNYRQPSRVFHGRDCNSRSRLPASTANRLKFDPDRLQAAAAVVNVSCCPRQPEQIVFQQKTQEIGSS